MALAPDLAAAVEAFAARGAPLLVATDFDGVLAPLVDDPAASRATAAGQTALDQLAASDGVTLALVSGRHLDALAEVSRAPAGTLLVGSHGAERGVVRSRSPRHSASQHLPDVARVPLDLSDAQRTALAALIAGLEGSVAGVDGAWVEHKPSAAVLHTRLAAPEDAAAVTERALEIAAELELAPMQGKDVVEVAVLETSKGKALAALRDELGASAVFYMGDDVTDERAFEALCDDDLTVKVGPGETAARFRVETPEDAAVVLAAIAAAVRPTEA
ncbi:hypothetical protein GCM10011331_22100 [Flavimobilis marinus]|uniref:Trehalose 6-phosphate phosphatase n=1 Tax=Flavimobilis marinus TaxID=285351 RepID=A0A1I2GSG6_9MICO|nr:trehalose-phosphatase [Flavimobilis marinus]GHG55426.1 hypothetical protein GCM10011331_22100 [Flavimobilis marinus]SFF20422.1 trehalose 6-phosphatase [Flavimobilis marinus]